MLRKIYVMLIVVLTMLICFAETNVETDEYLYLQVNQNVIKVGDSPIWTICASSIDADTLFQYQLCRQDLDATDNVYYSYGVSSVTASQTVSFDFTVDGRYYVEVVAFAPDDTQRLYRTELYEVREEDSAENTQTVLGKIKEIANTCRETGISDTAGIAKYMHNYLVDNSEYDYSYTYFYPDGVLLYGKGVCQSYALAYQALMREMGVECLYVTGTAGTQNVNHSWNMVKIDGEWYHVDCTFDDGYNLDYIIYDKYSYFLINDETIAQSHTWDRTQYPASAKKIETDDVDFSFTSEAELHTKLTEYAQKGIYSVVAKYTGADFYSEATFIAQCSNWTSKYGKLYNIDVSSGGEIKPNIYSFGFSCAVLPEDPSDEDYFVEGDYAYIIEEQGVVITQYLGKQTDVKVPAQINGLPVYKLANRAFYNNQSIVNVMLSEGLRYIEDGRQYEGGAFSKCNKLKSITFPSTLVSIGQYAFDNCLSLESVSFQNGLEEILDFAFVNCVSLKNVDLPETLTKLRIGSFSNTGISRIYLPASLSNISNDFISGKIEEIIVDSDNDNYITIDGVLYQKDRGHPSLLMIEYPTMKKDEYFAVPEGYTEVCGSFLTNKYLREVYFPASFYVFDINNTSWRSIIIDEDNPWYTSVDGVVYSKDMSKLVKYPANKENAYYEIPDSVSCIGHNAFFGQKYLKELTVRKHITDLEAGAFQQFLSLETAVFESGSSITTNCFFGGCVNLKSVTLPESLVHVVDNSFYNTLIESITLPQSVLEIGREAFANATSLKEVIVPDGLKTIGYRAFSGCSRLKYLKLPESVTTIHAGAFEGNHTDVTLVGKKGGIIQKYANENGEAFLTEEEYSALNSEVVYVWDQYSHKLVKKNADGTLSDQYISLGNHQSECSLPNVCSVCGQTDVYIDEEFVFHNIATTYNYDTDYHWYDCNRCNERVKLEKHTVRCSDLTQCIGCFENIANGIKIEQIEHLHTVVAGFDATCTKDGLTSGAYCSYCNEIIIKQEIIPASHKEVIDAEVKPTCTNKGLTEGKHCLVCNEILIVQNEISPMGHDEGTWMVISEATGEKEGVKHLRCTKCSAVLAEEIIPKLETRFAVTTEGVITRYLGHDTELEIPESINGIRVTEIANYAFSNCRNLEKIVIPNGVSAIGNYSFVGCTNLTTIGLPESVTSIGNSAFNGCCNLVNVVIPQNITSIGNHMFNGCSSLTTVRLPECVTSIGDYAFEGCSQLTDIVISNKVEIIGGGAFSGCSSLTSIALPESVTKIGSFTFSNCSQLTTVKISPNVTHLDDFTFDKCTGLTSITIPEGVTSIGTQVFRDCSNLVEIYIPSSVRNIDSNAFQGMYTCVMKVNCDGYARRWLEGKYYKKDVNHVSVTVTNGKVEPDCIHPGLTESRYCSSCDEVIEQQALIPALGHAETIIPSIPATHITTGMTEGKYCSRCGEVFAIQTEIPVVDVVTTYLPVGLEAVRKYAFASTAVECVILSENCKRVEALAFAGCAELRFIEIPLSVEFIDETAFDGCPADLVIVTTEGSFAHAFAQEKGIAFVLI